MRPLIVGEAPGATGDPLRPLGGSHARKLADWAGLVGDDRYEALRSEFDLVNLVDYYPGRAGEHSSGGAAFPRHEARESWSRLLSSRPTGVFVLLGARVRDVAGLSGTGWRNWSRIGTGAIAACVPHTSGLTRNYNDPAERAATGALLGEAIDLAARNLTGAV